ncbi:MAG: TerB family tellurite resistance protein [Gammaproteobacteria bacterium]|nr:TerB family tellurite resistance protein [Gammaproteobacteria bacterium]
MIDRLLKAFGLNEEAETTEAEGKRVQHSTAVLLIEIARADSDRLDVEREAMLAALTEYFPLSADEAAEVLSKAEVAAENSVSLHEFTNLLHSELSYDEKEQIVEMLWRIALADKQLDKYEDYMIGKISELLYVARGDVIRLKHRVYQSLK